MRYLIVIAIILMVSAPVFARGKRRRAVMPTTHIVRTTTGWRVWTEHQPRKPPRHLRNTPSILDVGPGWGCAREICRNRQVICTPLGDGGCRITEKRVAN